MKTTAEIIEELETKVEQEKKKGNHSLWAMAYIIGRGETSIIEEYFLDNGCYYAKLSSCGCGESTYDIILQWI
jgi:hypothetical protein